MRRNLKFSKTKVLFLKKSVLAFFQGLNINQTVCVPSNPTSWDALRAATHHVACGVVCQQWCCFAEASTSDGRTSLRGQMHVERMVSIPHDERTRFWVQGDLLMVPKTMLIKRVSKPTEQRSKKNVQKARSLLSTEVVFCVCCLTNPTSSCQQSVGIDLGKACTAPQSGAALVCVFHMLKSGG